MPLPIVPDRVVSAVLGGIVAEPVVPAIDDCLVAVRGGSFVLPLVVL